MKTESERLDRDFMEFHHSHPEVWRLYQRYAMDLMNAGHKHGSSEQIIQRVRWETAINPNRDGGFKINNNFRRRYAILMRETHNAFKDFFRERKQGGNT